ncbi:hypothetical protein [Streptomyces sp. Qhu_M48]
MAEQPTTLVVDFSAEVNIHSVDELTLGTYTGRSDDKEDFFEG